MNQAIKPEVAGNTTSTVNTEEPIIIAIDHGYGNIKTSNFCFPANVTPINDGLCFTDDILIYDGATYAIGMGHKEFRADKIMVKAALPWQSWFGPWPNCHGSILRIEARHRGLLPAHPGGNRKRTRQQRLRHALRHFLGAPEDELIYLCLKTYMMGALQRVFWPGCKCEYVLTLIGGQGVGKSTFFRFLAIRDDWFTDDLVDFKSSRIYEKINGHWIIEMPER